MESQRQPRRYYDLTFDADFLTAARDDGGRLRFTRLERAILATLIGRPGRLFSREQLLGAMSAEPEELSDRNVDFVINRLRKKLGDSARSPRYIATQYGEGYMWVAPAERPGRGGFLVIGPLRGLAETGRRPLIEDAIRRLHQQIVARCAVGQEIAFLPNWSREDGSGAPFRFSVSADFIVERGRLQAAFALRDERDGRVARVIRCEMSEDDLQDRLRELASGIIGAIWRDLVLAPGAELDPVGPPLEIRMQDAALTLSTSVDRGWGYIADRLAEAQAKAPDDPALAIMRATYIYARMLLGIVDADLEAHRRMEAEIERLALRALPAVRSDAILRLAAAKLLFTVDSRHLPLVEELVNESLAGSAAFAAALSQFGSIQAYRGELDAAVSSYDQALAFCQPGAEFQIYLLVKKSTVLLAKGDWTGALGLFHRIVEIKPAARHEIELFYLPPDDRPLDAEMQRALAKLSQVGARRLIAHQLFMFARYYARPEHRWNVMAGLAHHLLPRFGSSILPPEAPGLAAELLLELRRVAGEGPGKDERQRSPEMG